MLSPGAVLLLSKPLCLFACLCIVFQVHKVQPYETHFVWVSGSNWGKMHRMREHMYYKDPLQYYTGADYISIDLAPIDVSTY